MEKKSKIKQSINRKGFCDSFISSIYYFFSLRGIHVVEIACLN